MRETSGANDTLILWASDSGGEREFSLPVDGTITRMTLSAMFDTTGGVMTIVSPDGTNHIGRRSHRRHTPQLRAHRHHPESRAWVVAREGWADRPVLARGPCAQRARHHLRTVRQGRRPSRARRPDENRWPAASNRSRNVTGQCLRVRRTKRRVPPDVDGRTSAATRRPPSAWATASSQGRLICRPNRSA